MRLGGADETPRFSDSRTDGCGRDAGSPVSTSSPPPTSGAARPAEPATAGQLRTPPAGRVVSIGAAPEGIVVGRSGVGAVAVRNPDGVVLFTAATGVVRRRISTTAAARHPIGRCSMTKKRWRSWTGF